MAARWVQNFKVSVLFVIFRIEWCAKVMVTPELTSKIVFVRGKPQGSIAGVPKGGHIKPNSIEGDNE